MDCRGQLEKRIRKKKIPKPYSFPKLVKRKSHNKPGAYYSFLEELSKDAYGRIDPDDIYFKRLFSLYPEMISVFYESLQRSMSIKNDNVGKPNPAKKAKTVDDGSKAITLFDPISNESTSYASNYSQSPCSSDCYPLEWEAVASCSSSSPSRPGNAAEVYEDQKQENAESFDGTLYVTETKTRLLDGPQAYERLTELVNEIGAKRIDTYAIMDRASHLLQGYPELIESFNTFLPDGFKIVILSEDHEMSTD